MKYSAFTMHIDGHITQLGDFENQNHYKTVILKIKI